MNATEQRSHRTVTQSLDSRVAVLETLVGQLGQNCEWLKREIEREAEGRHADYQVHHIFAARSFSARLRWLFLGR